MAYVILILSFYSLGLTAALGATFLGVTKFFGHNPDTLIWQLLTLPLAFALTVVTFTFLSNNLRELGSLILLLGRRLQGALLASGSSFLMTLRKPVRIRQGARKP